MLATRYGDFANFLVEFNPSRQTDFCDTPEHRRRCFVGKAPTLSELRLSYGRPAPIQWLMPQLDNLALFSGCREKLSAGQLVDLADVIMINYHYLKVTELMVFFQMFKSGRYGKFYGSVDPLIITTALRDFIDYRNSFLDRIQEEEEERRREEARKKAISYEEYCRQNNVKPNPLLSTFTRNQLDESGGTAEAEWRHNESLETQPDSCRDRI